MLTALGRAQGRLASAGSAARLGGDELSAMAAELEESVALRIDARREVEEFLAPSEGPRVPRSPIPESAAAPH